MQICGAYPKNLPVLHVSTRSRMLAHTALATCYAGSASPRQIPTGSASPNLPSDSLRSSSAHSTVKNDSPPFYTSTPLHGLKKQLLQSSTHPLPTPTLNFINKHIRTYQFVKICDDLWIKCGGHGVSALPTLPFQLETHPFTTFNISSKIDFASFFEMR